MQIFAPSKLAYWLGFNPTKTCIYLCHLRPKVEDPAYRLKVLTPTNFLVLTEKIARNSMLIIITLYKLCLEQKKEKSMKIRASHILVATKEEAENLLLDIENGVSFEDLAKDYSKCPSGRDGGDLRWFGKGMMVKPFEDAAFALKEGEISAPVETQFGWHLIKCTGVDED